MCSNFSGIYSIISAQPLALVQTRVYVMGPWAIALEYKELPWGYVQEAG